MIYIRAFTRGLLLTLGVCSSLISSARHMVGGEIMYKCVGNNRFEITIIIFQDCLSQVEEEGINVDNPSYYSVFSTEDNSFISSRVTGLVSETNVIENYSESCIIDVPTTCLKRLEFKDTVSLPPSNAGYRIAYGRCCRTETLLNIQNPGNVSVVYQTIIPPFDDMECPNNSAVFSHQPPHFTCSDEPFFRDFSAEDQDGDSLSYELCSAMHMPELTGSSFNHKPLIIPQPPYEAVPYLEGYSGLYPIESNVVFQIHPSTGIVTGTPSEAGRYVLSICVKEWRDGIIKSTQSRELVLLVANCKKTTVADIPQYSALVNTYVVNCVDYSVFFENLSGGATDYQWDFGVPGATSEEFQPTFTYPDTGTYLVKLRVSAGGRCPDSIMRYVKIYPVLNADFRSDGFLCADSIIEFDNLTYSTHDGFINYQWNFGDGVSSSLGSPKHAFSNSGEYLVTLTASNQLGCLDTFASIVNIPPFFPFAGNDTFIVKDYPFRLQGGGGDYYSWTGSTAIADNLAANPLLSFSQKGSYDYIVTVSNDEGCIGYDTVRIQVINDDIFFLPTAFSPNGDGLNDTFYPVLIGYTRMKFLKVFNRWGEMVFISYEAHRGWDGTFRGEPSGTGVYFWQALVETPWGTEVIKSGDVTLLR